MSGAKAPCAALDHPHHSDDRVTVYHGAPAPMTLCGYHASPAWLPVVLNEPTGPRR